MGAGVRPARGGTRVCGQGTGLLEADLEAEEEDERSQTEGRAQVWSTGLHGVAAAVSSHPQLCSTRVSGRCFLPHFTPGEGRGQWPAWNRASPHSQSQEPPPRLSDAVPHKMLTLPPPHHQRPKYVLWLLQGPWGSAGGDGPAPALPVPGSWWGVTGTHHAALLFSRLPVVLRCWLHHLEIKDVTLGCVRSPLGACRVVLVAQT